MTGNKALSRCFMSKTEDLGLNTGGTAGSASGDDSGRVCEGLLPKSFPRATGTLWRTGRAEIQDFLFFQNLQVFTHVHLKCIFLIA